MNQILALKLHVIEHLAHCVAFDDRFQHDLPIIRQVDVDRIGVTKKVLQIP